MHGSDKYLPQNLIFLLPFFSDPFLRKNCTKCFMVVFFRMDVLCMFCRSQYYLNSCIISYSNRYNYVWHFEWKDFRLKYWWMSVFLEYISVGNRIFVSVVVFKKTFTFLYQKNIFWLLFIENFILSFTVLSLIHLF